MFPARASRKTSQAQGWEWFVISRWGRSRAMPFCDMGHGPWAHNGPMVLQPYYGIGIQFALLQLYICNISMISYVSYRCLVALVSLQSDLISWRSWAPIINLVHPRPFCICEDLWACGCTRTSMPLWLSQRTHSTWAIVKLAWGLEPRTAVQMIIKNLVMMMSLRGRCFSPAGDITIRVNANSSES